jgi:hypothetical protein
VSIKAQDIDRVFSEECIRHLVETCGLPTPIDLGRLRKGIHAAAHVFARDTQIPNSNAVHREIELLHRAADKRQCQKAATLLDALSLPALGLLKRRASRLGIKLPSSGLLLLNGRSTVACAKIARLCQLGGEYVKGRRRPTGKRSRPTWRPLLYAPKRSPHFAKREAERNFVIWLKLAWLEATNQPPSETADPSKPGPFARFVKECFKLAGAGHADAVGLINEISRRRRQMPP